MIVGDLYKCGEICVVGGDWLRIREKFVWLEIYLYEW